LTSARRNSLHRSRLLRKTGVPQVVAMAGLGCFDVPRTPARRRDDCERERRGDVRLSRIVGEPRITLLIAGRGANPRGDDDALVCLEEAIAHILSVMAPILRFGQTLVRWITNGSHLFILPTAILFRQRPACMEHASSGYPSATSCRFLPGRRPARTDLNDNAGGYRLADLPNKLGFPVVASETSQP
jgi:hypothetical protein